MCLYIMKMATEGRATHDTRNQRKIVPCRQSYTPYCPYWRWINALKSQLTSGKSLWNYAILSPGRRKCCLWNFSNSIFSNTVSRTIFRLEERKKERKQDTLDDEWTSFPLVVEQFFLKNVRASPPLRRSRIKTSSSFETNRQPGLAILLCGATRGVSRGTHTPSGTSFCKLFTRLFEELQIEREIGSDFRAPRASIFLRCQTL